MRGTRELSGLEIRISPDPGQDTVIEELLFMGADRPL